MTIDKRSVSTDALETLGMIIDETQKRDAIHLAVEPVLAKAKLYPGQHVAADGTSCSELILGVGIVDPFLTRPVEPGEHFWLVLYPRTIKSLRHVWEHPAFPPSEVQIEEIKAKVEKSKKWIEDYVEEIKEWCFYDKTIDDDLDYGYLMDAADKWVSSDYDDYLIFGFDNEQLNEEFWYHYEIIRGIKLEENKKKNFFSCAC